MSVRGAPVREPPIQGVLFAAREKEGREENGSGRAQKAEDGARRASVGHAGWWGACSAMGDPSIDGAHGIYHPNVQQEVDDRSISAPPVLELTAKVSQTVTLCT